MSTEPGAGGDGAGGGPLTDGKGGGSAGGRDVDLGPAYLRDRRCLSIQSHGGFAGREAEADLLSPVIRSDVGLTSWSLAVTPCLW